MGKKRKNRKQDNELAVIGIGAFLFLWLTGSKAVAGANLIFYPGNITGMAFVGTTPVLTFNMQVQNTSNTPLQINSFAGNAFSNNTLIGNVYNFLPTPIPANSMAQVPVTVQLNTIGLVNDLIKAFQFSNFTQNVSLQCVANVQGIQIPVNLSLSVGT